MQCRKTGGVAILIAAMVWGLGLSRPAQAAIGDGNWGPVSGTVIDATGRPAAGANVWLVVARPLTTSKICRKTVADAAGRFAFPQVKLSLSVQYGETPALMARGVEGRIGAARPRPQFGPPDASFQSNVTIQLLPSRDYEARLIDAAGKPIAGVSIAPQAFFSAPEALELFPELSAELSAKTDATGKFVLRGLPRRNKIFVTVNAPAFGSPRVSWVASATPTIRLERPGTIKGQAVLSGSRAGVAGVPIYARLSAHCPDQKWFIEQWLPMVTDKEGQFACENVPPGSYSIGMPSTGDVPYYLPRKFGQLSGTMKPGETVSVSVPLQRAVAVCGRVIDQQTRAGIPDIAVFATCSVDPHLQRIFFGVTDVQGKYTIYVQPGSASVSLGTGTSGSGYTMGSPRQVFQGELTKDIDCPVVELQHGKTLEGLVVDDHGRPVAGAEVRTKLDAPAKNCFLTDAAGKFAVPGLESQKPCSLRVRKGLATSKGDIVLDPAGAQTPVRVVISESNAFSLSGTCLDEAGRPLPGAAVSIDDQWSPSGYAQTQRGVTDPAGRFQIAGLWPGDLHHVVVKADGYAEFNCDPVTSSAGKTHDFGRLRLLSTHGQIEGVVVDSQGKPLSGVEVLNRGYIQTPPAVTTDASGRFRLEGFLPGPARVFAVKEGYRFTGVRTQSGTRGLVVKLLRKDEPIQARPRVEQSSSVVSQRQQLACKVIDRLWADCHNDEDRVRVLLLLARIDPAVAVERTEKVGGEAKRTARMVAAFAIADRDLDEGLSRTGDDVQVAYCVLHVLAERYVTTDPAKALRCAEEMAIRARAADQPMRTEALAEAAALVARSGGNKVSGRKLAEEAAAMALAMKSNAKQAQLAAPVGEALACYDVDRAIQFLESMGAYNLRNSDCVARVAAAAATVDLAKARTLLYALPAGEGVQLGRARMAYRLASSRPAEAKQLLDGPDPWKHPLLKAEVLGWLALRAAPRDKPLAWAAIDEALELCNDRGTQSRWPPYAPSIHAAIVALEAGQIGYPDMQSAVDRALAAQRSSRPAETGELCTVALILSLADPAVARQLLLDGGDAPGKAAIFDLNRGLWFAAWAMIDPQRADEYLQRSFPSAKAGKADAEELPEWLFMAAEILTTPPSDRLRYFASRLGQSTIVESCPW